MAGNHPRYEFDKDSWIKRALASGHIRAERDGSVLRRSGDGYKPIKMTTHVKTQRIYFTLTFEGESKSVLTNRVIALAFLPNPKGHPDVNHKSGNKSDNSVENLEWASRSENERHAVRTGLKTTRGSHNSNAKLTAAQVIAIRARKGETLAKLAEEFGVSVATIHGILTRRSWSHV